MTTQAQHRTAPDSPGAADAAAGLLPSGTPIQFLDDDGAETPPAEHGTYKRPPTDLLVDAYRRMVRGRRYNAQATALTKQGRLAVYPSSTGQEACEVAAALVPLGERDWLFPSYRDTLAAVSRAASTPSRR